MGEYVIFNLLACQHINIMQKTRRNFSAFYPTDNVLRQRNTFYSFFIQNRHTLAAIWPGIEQWYRHKLVLTTQIVHFVPLPFTRGRRKHKKDTLLFAPPRQMQLTGIGRSCPNGGSSTPYMNEFVLYGNLKAVQVWYNAWKIGGVFL